jgi:predicted metal-dependent HD superfamily phosphohydrolase
LKTDLKSANRIKEIFLESLHQFEVADQKLLLWQEIEASYAKPGRHYHTLVHLESLCKELLPFRSRFDDWDAVVFSIAYHDFVYNPVRNDNEEKSAAYAVKKLKELSCADHLIDRCRSLILATKKHEALDDQTNLFTDADLSILGAPSNIYQDYVLKIRKEYNVYPNFLYNPGRKKVLSHFLQMKTIFKTADFFEKYEKQARLNLEAELRLLS